MSIIVEDGTCVLDAESYVSVVDADAYHAKRGMTNWSLLTTLEKEQALVRATDFMVARYRGQWKGAKVRYEQALDWPRVGVNPNDNEPAFPGHYMYVYPYTSIPKEVKAACCELALRAAAGPLVVDETQKVIQETVGPITTKYDPYSSDKVRYTQVDMMLGPLLSSGGNSAMVKLFRC